MYAYAYNVILASRLRLATGLCDIRMEIDDLVCREFISSDTETRRWFPEIQGRI